jgi:glycogen debranching enzyme
MNQKILLTLFSAAIITSTEAQKKQDRVTVYAITGAEKGSRGWNEVNLVDVTTGEVITPVYQTKSEVRRLNAHVFDFVLPAQIAKGTYLVRVLNEANNPMNAEKIIVQ